MSKRYKTKRRERYRLRVVADAIQAIDTGPCWCGEPKPYFAPITPCGGSRIITCLCGGDFCVCHWHGETECFGCEDCEPDFDRDEDDKVLKELA